LEDGQENSCQVLPGEEAEVCTICAEQFEQFWEEELEEWHFREAIRHEGKVVSTRNYCSCIIMLAALHVHERH
jgi:hypothetical protein